MKLKKTLKKKRGGVGTSTVTTPPTHPLRTNEQILAITAQQEEAANFVPSDEMKSIIALCPNAEICLDLSTQYKQSIFDYFDKFHNFASTDYASPLGKESANGIVLKVPFLKGGYSVNMVLKIARNQYADNLSYEFAVGTEFINYVINIFPNFVATLGLYQFGEEEYNYVIACVNQKIPVNLTSLHLSPVDLNWREACKKPTRQAVLIQHFQKFQTIDAEIRNNFRDTLLEMPCILFQIYFCLDVLKDQFTHYDLHAGNVGFYKLSDDIYFLLKYHFNDGTSLVIPTVYLAKIIDYGRCHIPKTSDIVTQICHESACHPACGDSSGFQIIKGIGNEDADDATSSFYWINPIVRNQSHDLRFIADNQRQILGKYRFCDRIEYKSRYGTNEDLRDFSDTDRIVRNVSGARKALQKFLVEYWFRQNHIDAHYIRQGLTLAGVINIYEDGRPYEMTNA